MYRIADLVKLDKHITEQSVVQIDSYEEREKNLELLKRFVFSRRAPGNRLSNLQILYRLYEACLTSAKENVFCIIANYGQGKSHFGLVLANFFGRPHDSEEFSVILDKIAHSGEDAPRVANFRVFRQERPPYLVVRLRGDNLLPLDQQFLGAVKRSLKDAGLDGPLPLCYESAAAWLKTLPEKSLEDRANDYLRAFNCDLRTLISRVEDYDRESYDLVLSLHRHLVGTLPQFEGELASGELLKWLVGNYCKTENKFGGVLILFDEFSQFIERYYHNRSHAGSLQKLLETVDQLRPRVLFLAFAQHDPVEIVRSTLAGRGQTHLDEAVRELQRIPTNNKLLLHTQMEEVLDGYLRQEGTHLPTLLGENPTLDDLMWDAGSLTMQAFPERYSSDQGWTPARFHEVVTKGCFPLHPLTTAILAAGISTPSAQTETPRTVLGFVLEAVKGKLEEPAITASGRLNWIYADSLVDYFWNMLPDFDRTPYHDAVRRLGGGASPTQQKILKGILLIDLLGRKDERFITNGDTFLDMIAALTGEPPTTLKKELQTLSNELVLIERGGTFTFPTRGGDPEALKHLETQVLSKPFSEADLKNLNELVDVGLAVSVDWGHPDDWEAGQMVWRVGDLSAEKLRREVPRFSTNAGKLDLETKRGVVVRLLALEEEDLKDLEERVKESLDEAFPEDDAPAVIIVLPSRPTPDLPYLLRLRKELKRLLDNEKDTLTQKIGLELIRHRLVSVEKELEKERSRFLHPGSSTGQRTSHFLVPKAYRMLFLQKSPQQLEEALGLLYAFAYRYAPPFFKQYHRNSRYFRKDVVNVCRNLADDLIAEFMKTSNSGPGKDCVEQFLKRSWQILDENCHLKPPQSDPVRRAWNLLESKLSSPGQAVRIASIIEQLLNPPFGYGFPQLALLLSAWYGLNRKTVEVWWLRKELLPVRPNVGTISAPDPRAYANVRNLKTIWDEKDLDRCERFLTTLVHRDVIFVKKDLEKEEKNISAIVDRILGSGPLFSQEEARANIEKLELWIQGQDRPSDLTEKAQKALETLKKDLRCAEEYDRRAVELNWLAETGSSIANLVEALINDRLPTVSRVMPSMAGAAEIRKRLMKALGEQVEKKCEECEKIDRLEDFSKFSDVLKNVLKRIKAIRSQDLERRVELAIRRVEERAEELRQKEEVKAIRAKVAAMTSEVPLKTLRMFLAELAQLPQDLDEVTGKCQELKKAADRYLGDLERWRSSFTERCELGDLAALEEEIRKSSWRYEGCEEASKVEDLLTLVQNVRRIIIEILEEGNSQPECPDDVRAGLKRIEKLAFGSSHPAIVRAATLAKKQLEDFERREVAKARHWLAKLREKAPVASLQELEHILYELSSPEPFFPPEAKRELDALREEVEKRREQLFFESVKERLREFRDLRTLRELREAIDKRLTELEGAPSGQPR